MLDYGKQRQRDWEMEKIQESAVREREMEDFGILIQRDFRILGNGVRVRHTGDKRDGCAEVAAITSCWLHNPAMQQRRPSRKFALWNPRHHHHDGKANLVWPLEAQGLTRHQIPTCHRLRQRATMATVNITITGGA